jgi:hypothetical protein
MVSVWAAVVITVPVPNSDAMDTSVSCMAEEGLVQEVSALSTRLYCHEMLLVRLERLLYQMACSSIAMRRCISNDVLSLLSTLDSTMSCEVVRSLSVLLIPSLCLDDGMAFDMVLTRALDYVRSDAWIECWVEKFMNCTKTLGQICKVQWLIQMDNDSADG